MRIMASGAAPLSEDLHRFLRVRSKVLLLLYLTGHYCSLILFLQNAQYMTFGQYRLWL